MGTAAAPIVLVLGGEETERLLDTALAELDVHVDHFEDQEEFGRVRRPADLVLLEHARIPEPGTVEGWLSGDLLDPTVPLLLMAPSPVGATEYAAWLSAGVWDVVRLPVDPAILSHRLRNLLGARRNRHGQITPTGPYPWRTLVRATGEALALGRRQRRPVCCMAIGVDMIGQAEPPARLLFRLGTAVREWVRNSDLVGLSDRNVLLVVLPDTDDEAAAIVEPRVLAALERSLRRSDVPATLRSATSVAPAEGPAMQFLLDTIGALP